jgi:nucleotide-binding universal stress UspA family protein
MEHGFSRNVGTGETGPSYRSLNDPLARRPRRTDPLQMMLVLEEGKAGNWVLPWLPQLVNPREYECHLVQAMEGISHEGWIQAEPESFWEMISHRRRSLHKSRQEYHQQLGNLGFSRVEESVSDRSDAGQDHLLQEIHKLTSPTEPRLKYDLLVLGTAPCVTDAGSRRPGQIVSGFTSHLTAYAPCSVLVLRNEPTLAQGRVKVLLATDGSEASQRAASRLGQLLRPEALDVVVLTVINPAYLENPVLAPYVNVPAIDEAYRQNGEMVLTLAQGMLEAQGIHVNRVESVVGTPHWELLRRIQVEEPDLVVVGSHNRQGSNLWLLGSVSHEMLKSDRHNLLIVR